MTNDSIECLIDALNANEMADLIFKTSLSLNVDYAKVWTEEPKGLHRDEGYEFFFIKNETGVYVAAVLDMYNDLHVFVKKAYRKQGYLSKAMNEIILPKLHQGGRIKQMITFCRFSEMASYVDKNWGFSIIDNSSAEKDLSIFSDVPQIEAKPQNLTSEDFSQIKVKINKAKGYIAMIKAQLEMAYGECNETYLQSTIYDLEDLGNFSLVTGNT
jgi:hypothetical protein